MRKFLIFIVIFTSCIKKGNNTNADLIQKPLNVRFIIDDSIQFINDRFKIFLVYSGDTLSTEVKGNQIFLPKIFKDSGYGVVFKYSTYILSFKGFTREMLLPDQDMEWIIGIDNKPFNKSTGLLWEEEYNYNSYNQLQYFQFNPQEHGDGIQFVNRNK